MKYIGPELDKNTLQLLKPKDLDEQQGRWTKEEHELFLKGNFLKLGLQKFGRNWKLIEQIIQTRNCAQIRSHAQKFFHRIRSKSKLKKKTQLLSTASSQKENVDQNKSYFSCIM